MSHYDGEIFQTLLQRDGLGSNIVVDILTAAYGSVWIATEGGARRPLLRCPPDEDHRRP